MKVLKKKFRKIQNKTSSNKISSPLTSQEGIVLKPIRILKPIKIKPKLGRWCDCYNGRLPYPIECQGNKSSPVSYIFDAGERTLLHDRSICVDCKRQVEFIPWKRGEWNKVKEAIAKGEDLRDMDPPFREIN